MTHSSSLVADTIDSKLISDRGNKLNEFNVRHVSRINQQLALQKCFFCCCSLALVLTDSCGKQKIKRLLFAEHAYKAIALNALEFFMEVDLIDDVWQQVFNYLGVYRARLATIKTLRRLYVRFVLGGYSAATVYINSDRLIVPQCKDLVFLNLNIEMNPKDLQKLLLGLSNIEELYLCQDFTTADVFVHSQKLKLLALASISNENDPELQKLSDLVPSLRCLLYKGRISAASDISTVGNMILIPDTALEGQLDLEKSKQLGLFVSPELQPLLLIKALLNRCSKEVVEYLINERKYEVNYAPFGKFLYMEDSQSHFKNVISYPLLEALGGHRGPRGKPLTKSCRRWSRVIVAELLKYGADPNSPFSNDSPLVYCCDSITFLLLIKYGANPNKLVDGYPAAWSLFNKRFVDPEIALNGILEKIDINAEYNEKSILSRAIHSKHRSVTLVKMLIEAGAQLSSNLLDALFTNVPELASSVLNFLIPFASVVRENVVASAHFAVFHGVSSFRRNFGLSIPNNKGTMEFIPDSADREALDLFTQLMVYTQTFLEMMIDNAHYDIVQLFFILAVCSSVEPSIAEYTCHNHDWSVVRVGMCHESAQAQFGSVLFPQLLRMLENHDNSCFDKMIPYYFKNE